MMNMFCSDCIFVFCYTMSHGQCGFVLINHLHNVPKLIPFLALDTVNVCFEKNILM